MNVSHLEAVRRIEATYPDLDWWAERGRRDDRPQKGGQFERDGAIWPYHTPWEVTHWSLVGAVDHLNLVRASLASKRGPGTAEFTALRGALVGGSRAVWLAAPDDPHTRQQRALRIIHEWYVRHNEWVGAHDVAALDADSAERHARLMEHNQTSAEQVLELWEPTPGCAMPAKRGLPQWPRQTAIMLEAAMFTWPDEVRRRAVDRAWRVSSGDSHVLSWSNTTRVVAMQRPDSNDVSLMTAAPSVAELAEVFTASYELVRRGWRLLDQRGERA